MATSEKALPATPFAGRFCRMPFDFATVDVSGNVNLCCQGYLPKTVGNVLTQSLAEIWNASAAQEIRASILDGSYRFCTKECPYLCGDVEGTVFDKDDVIDPIHREIIDKSLTQIDRGPIDLLPAYDATCNLACPGCRTETIAFSGAQREFAESIHEVIARDWLGGLRFLILSGQGDPFASPIYRGILRDLPREEFPGLRIGIITNALLFTPAMWESMSATRHRIAMFHVSVNGTSPETFEHVQRGGSWKRFQENLDFIAGLRRAGQIPHLRLTFYTSAINFHEMKDFIRLGLAHAADELELGLLLNPGTYSDAEYEAVAIHLPGHPRHADFRAALDDPIFLDPVIRLGNLLPWLPPAIRATRDAAQRHAARGPAALASLEALSAWLGLDNAGQGQLREFLIELKAKFADIIATPPAEGGLPPLLRLAQHRTTDPNATETTGEALLLGIMRSEHCGDTGSTYAKRYEIDERMLCDEFSLNLAGETRSSFLRLGTGALLAVPLDTDPIGEAVQRLVAQYYTAA